MSGALRLIKGTERWRCATLGIAGALLVSTLVILDRVPWPVLSALDKLPYILAGGLILGLYTELRHRGERPHVVISLTWVTVVLLWLGWPQLQRTDTIWSLSGLALSGLVMTLRARSVSSQPDFAIMTGVAGLGVAGVAIASGSLLIGELSLALTATIVGSLVWCFGRGALRLGASIVPAGVTPLLALAALTLLLTDANPLASAVLILVFFADRAALVLPVFSRRPLLHSVYVAVLAAAPVALAIGLVLITDAADDLYYG